MANQPLLRNWPRKLPNMAKYANKGHSRLPILVPIESPYIRLPINY